MDADDLMTVTFRNNFNIQYASLYVESVIEGQPKRYGFEPVRVNEVLEVCMQPRSNLVGFKSHTVGPMLMETWIWPSTGARAVSEPFVFCFNEIDTAYFTRTRSFVFDF